MRTHMRCLLLQVWSVVSKPQTSIPLHGSTRSASSFLGGSSHSIARIAWGATYLAGAGAIAAGSFSSDVRLAYIIPSRLARDVYTAATIVADYKVSLGDKVGEDRETALRECHQRAADRLVDLCFKNGGIYIKLGQHLGQLDHILPEEYVVTMRKHMLDRCPVSSLAEVRQVFVEDFGKQPEQMYKRFEPTPFASASLAQVHMAEDFDGRKLAVKVQHAGLRESCTADIATIEFLVKAVKFVFPTFDYEWLVEETKLNLPKELDFMHEYQNAERCRANFASAKSKLHGQVHIPQILPGRTSHRVLTMEYIDGAGVTDTEALKQLGIRPQALAKLISQAFNEMIFMHGDVHCDPHAANMLVRKKDGHMQLVLLDHGLYRQIDDQFRIEYAALWRSLIFADVDGIKKHSQSMNAGDAYPLFAAMLTQKPWEEVVEQSPDHLAIKPGQEHKEQIRTYAARYAKEISNMLGTIPRPLLLLLKTNDCLRSVDRSLGQPVNTFVITARQCTRALAEERMGHSHGIMTWLQVHWDLLRVELRMYTLYAVNFAQYVKSRLKGTHQMTPKEWAMIY